MLFRCLVNEMTLGVSVFNVISDNKVKSHLVPCRADFPRSSVIQLVPSLNLPDVTSHTVRKGLVAHRELGGRTGPRQL